MIISYKNTHPKIEDAKYIAPNASIIGGVHLQKDSVVLFNAVLRGEEEPVRIKEGAAILDNSFIEGSIIGKNSLISHGANLHFAKVEEEVLIGIGAILLDGSVIKSGAIIGAGAVVLPNTTVPSNVLFTGVPGKKIKKIEDRTQVHEALEKVREKSKFYKKTKCVKKKDV